MNPHYDFLKSLNKDQLLQLNLQQQKDILKAIIEAQESERTRIGEQLHDSVAQLLYAIQTRLHLLKNSDCDQDHLAGLNDIVQEAIRQTRTISFELVPVILKDYGVEVALNELFKRVFDEHIRYTFSFTANEKQLTDELKTATYRIIQELCNNIVKHSQATEVSVSVQSDKTKLTIRVKDNGQGFDVAQTQASPTGTGLQHIRNRVDALNGSFRLRSGGSGAELNVELPLSPPNRN